MCDFLGCSGCGFKGVGSGGGVGRGFYVVYGDLGGGMVWWGGGGGDVVDGGWEVM